MDDNRASKRKVSKEEFSAGGLVFRGSGDDIRLLIIMPAGADPTKDIWVFPKGWIGDHGEETIEQGALREVREEGGVEAEIKADLGEVSYRFEWNGSLINKTVHYFLMQYVSGDPSDHDHEVAEARFVPVPEAYEMLTYGTDREMLRKAKEILGI